MKTLSKLHLLISVFFESVLPYLKQKFTDVKWVQIVVKIMALAKFVTCFRYLLSENLFYKPYYQIFGFLVRRQNNFEANQNNKQNTVLKILSQYNLFLIYLFKVYLEWHFGQQKQSPPVSAQTVIRPPPKRTGKGCGICKAINMINPCVLTTSGFAFCYNCITVYLQENGRCPVTGGVATNS